jgi:aspartyl protease family protein
MVVDVLKLAMRPLALAAICAVLAVKGPDLVRLMATPRGAEDQAPAQTQRAPAPATGGGYMILDGDQRGHFQTDVQVEGVTLKMLVDTGASSVALTAEDAERAGIHPFPNDYTGQVNTANGSVRVALVELRQVTVGPITVRDVQAVVLPRGATQMSLLGMTFLQRLSGFQVSDNRLVMRP